MDGNTSLMREVNGEWPDWFDLTEMYVIIMKKNIMTCPIHLNVAFLNVTPRCHTYVTFQNISTQNPSLVHL